MKRPRLQFGIGRWALGVRRSSSFALLLLSRALFAQDADSTSGYGPPTSLPADLSMTKPASRPARNWIDQSQAEADAKSIGCNQCHKGIEPMHQASHVILGCTDCHGGNSEVVTYQFPQYAPDCAACHSNDFSPGSHRKTWTPQTNYNSGELRDCTGACHIYEDLTMTTIHTHKPGPEHHVTDRGFGD